MTCYFFEKCTGEAEYTMYKVEAIRTLGDLENDAYATASYSGRWPWWPNAAARQEKAVAHRLPKRSSCCRFTNFSSALGHLQVFLP